MIIFCSDSETFEQDGRKRAEDDYGKTLICRWIAHAWSLIIFIQPSQKNNKAWFMLNSKVSKSFSMPYLRRFTFGLQWTSLLISGHYIRDRACVSWVVLLASMTPRVPEGSATLYWEVSGNSDASCLCGNNTHSCSAILQSQYEVPSMSRGKEKTNTIV